MIKKGIFIILSGLLLGGCSLVPKRSGIEIMSYPTAKIFIDGKEAGMTPYKNNVLKPGISEIKLNTQDQEWSKKIELKNNTTTVLNWEFEPKSQQISGYVLSMEKTGNDKKAGLIVNAIPNQSVVQIDGENQGFAPLKIEDIGDGDKQVSISFPRHKTIHVFVKAVKGYQLIIEAQMAQEEAPVVNQEIETTVIETMGVGESQVVIKETETGWLRVRDSASSTGKEISQIKPTEKYKLIQEQSGWYQIELKDGTAGWISAKYADKVLQ